MKMNNPTMIKALEISGLVSLMKNPIAMRPFEAALPIDPN
jgi:hypothetical protein